MPRYSPHRRPARSRGFTLIELLTVIAVIGILASILVPVISSVRTSEKRHRTELLYNEIADAMQNYKLMYGHYPIFATKMSTVRQPDSNGDVSFKLNDATGFLIHVLSSDFLSTDTTYLPYNPRQHRFLQVEDSMLAYASGDGLHTNPLVADAFGDTDIGVVVNITGAESIATSSVNSAQPVTSIETGRSASPELTGGETIPQSIVIYSYDGTITPSFLANFDYSTYSTTQ